MSWSSKKQNCVALCTAEVEYIAAGACCAQLLWMKQTLRDFGCDFKRIPLLCDNESAIKLANNSVQHSNDLFPDHVKHINAGETVGSKEEKEDRLSPTTFI